MRRWLPCTGTCARTCGQDAYDAPAADTWDPAELNNGEVGGWSARDRWFGGLRKDARYQRVSAVDLDEMPRRASPKLAGQCRVPCACQAFMVFAVLGALAVVASSQADDKSVQSVQSMLWGAKRQLWAKVAPNKYACQGANSTEWSVDEASWCCSHRRIRGACAAATEQTTATTAPAKAEPLYDCGFVGSQGALDWPIGKQLWCCRHEGVDCTGIPTFNCADGLSTWRTDWSLSKKEYCCQTEGLACPPVPVAWRSPASAMEVDYDCDEGFSTREQAWSASKSKYCCEKYSKGCSQTDKFQ